MIWGSPVAVVAKKVFARLQHTYQWCPFLGQEALRTITRWATRNLTIAGYYIRGCP